MARAKPGTIALAGLRSGAITRQAIQLGLPVHIVASHKADHDLLPYRSSHSSGRLQRVG